ncbi:hypothetical protein D3C74_495940 [compost metagenome]
MNRLVKKVGLPLAAIIYFFTGITYYDGVGQTKDRMVLILMGVAFTMMYRHYKGNRYESK